MLENYTATYDATVIKKLKEAGSAFCRSHQHGRVRNGLFNRAFCLRRNQESTRHLPCAGRLLRRLRRRCCRAPVLPRSVPTQAAPYANQQHSRVLWGSSRPMAPSRARGSSRWAHRSTRSARSRSQLKTRRSFLMPFAVKMCSTQRLFQLISILLMRFKKIAHRDAATPT